MKVTVYETFENMRTNQYPIEINNVTGIDQSKTGGWLLTTDEKAYMFTPNVFIIAE